MKKWQLQEAVFNSEELASRSNDVTNFLLIDYNDEEKLFERVQGKARDIEL
ncbi:MULTISPECIES: hypothetical protein [unclassified Candidatus Tisiphia]|uniref:hypothetical protein n=1 Tax=unclassified Candidatus Tisiphia TaxID=2996318 RepID=UPI0035C9049D